MAKRRPIVPREQETQPDVDMSPMLALMVTLIPLLLGAMALVQVKTIDTQLPQVVQDAINEDRQLKERPIEVSLDLLADFSIELNLRQDGKNLSTKKISGRTDSQAQKIWSLDELRTELVGVKSAHPKLFRIKLFPAPSLKYQDIVRVIDEVRATQPQDPKLYLIDPKTQQQVEHTVLFPDVEFGNVIEG